MIDNQLINSKLVQWSDPDPVKDDQGALCRHKFLFPSTMGGNAFYDALGHNRSAMQQEFFKN